MQDKTSLPTNSDLLDPRVDKEQAFLLYATFCGDAVRAAHALDIPVETLRAVAAAAKWDAKLRPIIEMKGTGNAGDVERAVNRALNFVQAHRMRGMLERVLKKLCDMTPSDLEAFLFPKAVSKKDQQIVQTLSTKALSDLAAALEKCHAMTYLALNDTATERKGRGSEDSGDATAAETHLRLAAAMQASAAGSKSISGRLADAQLEIAQDYARVDLKP